MLGRKESNTHSGKKGWVVVIHTASLTSPPFFFGGGAEMHTVVGLGFVK